MGLCSVWWEVAGPSHHLMTGDSFETQEGGHGCCSWHIWKAECICNRKQLVKVKQALPRENSFAFLHDDDTLPETWCYDYPKDLFPREELAAPCTMNLFQGYFNSSPSRHVPITGWESRHSTTVAGPGVQADANLLYLMEWELFLWVVSSGPQYTYRLDWWFKTRWFKVKLLKGTPRSLPPSSSQGKDAPLLSPAPQAKLCRSRDLEQWGPAAIDRLDLLFTQKTSIL